MSGMYDDKWKAGGRRVTCAEAARMLMSGEANRAWFRPGPLVTKNGTPFGPDDAAIVWNDEVKVENKTKKA